jgi:N-acetylglucosamine kinase-like BadF-type ATPase
VKAVSVGVDWGGTWLRVVGVDRVGRTIFQEKRPSPSRARLVSTLRSVLSRRRLKDLDVLIIGGKGIWKRTTRREWTRRLKPLARRVTALSDVEIAHRAAFDGKPGVLILAGTGSIALGIDSKGRLARAGGLGPEKGDEGSGYWIGKKYLAVILSESEGSRRSPKTEILRGACPRLSVSRAQNDIDVRGTAALAPKVLRKAVQGDPECLAIIRGAQGHLAHLIVDVVGRLWKTGTAPVSWAGGLMGDRDFRKGVLRQARLLLIQSGLSLKLSPPRRDPSLAAALWGLGHFLSTRK